MLKKIRLEKLAQDNEAPRFTHLPCKVLPGGIYLMSTKSVLCFHEKEMLKRERLDEKL